MSLVECGSNILLRGGVKSAVCVALISIAGCFERVNMGAPEITAKNTVSEKIAFKKFSTGEVASKELESARDNPSSWSYFGEMRRVKVVTLADKTVVDFGFGLNSSFEASQLKDEMASRFKSKGSPDFSLTAVATQVWSSLQTKEFKFVLKIVTHLMVSKLCLSQGNIPSIENR